MLAVLLHDIRSIHNVGSIFRTADAFGVGRIYLSGYTPQPIDRFGRQRRDLAKTALGAETFVPWEFVENPFVLMVSLKKEGWRVVGIEQDARSRPITELVDRGDTLILFGSEVVGMSEELRSACDELCEIPMLGKKESLNVSVAAGIALFCARQKQH